MIYDDIVQTIGDTPIVKLRRLGEEAAGTVCVKCEYFNPGGSVKDRIGLKMIEAAEAEGKLRPGGTIVEGTSGNTGMGLCLVASLKGYRTIFTMPDKMSQEKINLLKAFGAEVIVCPTAVEPDDPRSYYSVARRLSEEIPNSFYPNQYDNPNNPEAHYESTGPEIWKQTEGRITHFVCGLGTGGTVTGTGKFLKEQNPNVRVIGADPIGSLYHEYFRTGEMGRAHTYLVEGIGEDIIPTTIDFQFVDEVVQVTDKECFLMARELARREGIFTGGSGGAALAAALKVSDELGPDDLMLVLLPDTGERYLSKVYNDEWMRENQFLEPRFAVSAQEILAAKGGEPKDLVSVGPDSLCRDALDLMKRFEISQLPVLEGLHSVGRVAEDTMIDLLVGGKNLADLPVRDVMKDPLPVVTGQTNLNRISAHLHEGNPAVLVDVEDGRFGIITKFDLLHILQG